MTGLFVIVVGVNCRRDADQHNAPTNMVKQMTYESKRRNAELLTPEEAQMEMGQGYLVAANRLGLIYLANVVTLAHLLSRFVEQAMLLVEDRDAGWYTDAQMAKAVDELAVQLAEILRGENPRYMAILWFTHPNHLRRYVYETLAPDYAEDMEASARLKQDPILEDAVNFLWMSIEPDMLDYQDGGIQGLIVGHAKYLLEIPDSVPLTFVGVRFASRRCISVWKMDSDKHSESRSERREGQV